MYARACDICQARGQVQTFAITHKSWKNGPRIDVCKRHEILLFHIRSWPAWKVGMWIAADFPEIEGKEQLHGSTFISEREVATTAKVLPPPITVPTKTHGEKKEMMAEAPDLISRIARVFLSNLSRK